MSNMKISRIQFFLIIVFTALITLMIGIHIQSCGETRTKTSPFVLGRIIADYHLAQIKTLPEFENLKLNVSSPIHSLYGNKIVAYDVKLIDRYGADRGFILVNLDRSDSPVVFFTSEGPSITEILQRKAPDKENLRMVYLSPTYIVALDPENNIVASMGNYYLKKETIEKYKNKKISTMERLSLIRDEMKDYLYQFKEDTEEEWDEVYMLLSNIMYAKKKDFKLKRDLPYKQDFYIYYAEGHERYPYFDQIEPHTGLNPHDGYSGCAATAWAVFIRWHDLLWTPELLKGSQNTNMFPWGRSDHPNHEDTHTCYNNRLIMELHEALETRDDGNTYDWNVDQGFDYIHSELNHSTSSQTHWKSNSTCVQKAYEYIRNKERPAIIGICGHLCILMGFCNNLNSDDLDRQWLYINTCWMAPATGYMKAKHLKAMWYTSHIRSTTQHSYNQFRSKKGVSFLTLKLDASIPLRNNLWAFWLADDGKIHYVRTASQEHPLEELRIFNPETHVVLDVNAKFPPSVCTDDQAVYLVYADTNKKIHLMRYLLTKEELGIPEANRWQELPFPDLVTEVQPAITGGIFDWLTITFYNTEYGVQKIASNKDIGRPDAWPQNPFVSGVLPAGIQSTWFLLGGVTDGQKTNYGLGIARFNGSTIVSWVKEDYTVCFWGSESGGWGSPYAYKVKNYIEERDTLFLNSAPSLFVFNNTLFLTCAKYSWLAKKMDYAFRIYVYDLDVTPPSGTESGEMEIRENCRLTETCIDDPCIGIFGTNPILGWFKNNNELTLRLISIDTDRDPINYRGPI